MLLSESKSFGCCTRAELCESAVSRAEQSRGREEGRERSPVGVAGVLEGSLQNHSWRFTLKQEASGASRRVCGRGGGGEGGVGGVLGKWWGVTSLNQ